MPRIIPLPPHVVNKIAAGEVVERPASVVKELMENAIDAGAKRIDVALEQGGVELVRVVDDGCGLGADELLLAVTSHATSKIRSDEDLMAVGTLGFRGEALASIASVSRMVLRSRQSESTAGAELEVVGGTHGEVAPCGAPVGTLIEVRQLFFNTPVRRKFLRTTQTEMASASEAFTRLALGYPHVHFSFSHNGRVQYDLPPVTDWRERIAGLFDRELADSLIDIESVEGPIRLSGFVANPQHSRPNNRMQYLLLNGRSIRDRGLQHALGEGYRGLLMTGRHPIGFLRLTLPPELVDVNVHPTKMEVRFQDSGRLYSQLLGTIRSRFLSSNLTARMQGASPAADAPQGMQTAGAAGRSFALRQQVVDWATAELARRGPAAQGAALLEPGLAPAQEREAAARSMGFQPVHAGNTDLQPADARSPLSIHRLDPAELGLPGRLPTASEVQVAAAEPEAIPALEAPGASALPLTPRADGPLAMQILDSYLIAETDEGMVVIDQHALHERILYEQIRGKVVRGAIERQNLLVPEPVDLAPAEAAAVLEAADMLTGLGIAVSSFGGGTVLLSSYPAMLAHFRPAELLQALAALLLTSGREPKREDVLDSLMHMIACKAAVKAGDRLSLEEIAALLTQRELAQDAHHCPHGRPTALVFTREDLDRQFKRT
ncbi:MAG: DNA mismatch repair endonuclease MutL [Planctomycetes bacterium]|nr:DNA mismatch repair endonuclease MutL [Planctomycetota bacterium]